MEEYKCKSTGIIGSGIQGICVGLQLIKKGIPVTIFDKHDQLSSEFKPASYGNAGHFSPYAVLQFNLPDILNDVPKMLFSSYGPLALKWSYIPRMIPWFINYFKNCNTKSMMHTAKYMHQILNLSNDAYEEIFKEIDTTNLKDNKWYINTNITYAFGSGKVTGSYGTATAKAHADALYTQADEDAGRGTKDDVKTEGLKTVLIRDIKESAEIILNRTDWYVTRKAEKSTAIPSSITTHRDSVRTKQASMETAITNASDTPALETLYTRNNSGVRPLGDLPNL